MDTLSQLAVALSERYVVDREIGRGGMATVYLARDVRHDRHVALKVLDPELGAVLGVERFLSEIRVTANLQHPNLLPLFDSGEAGGLLFYVMPYVAGESLRHRLDREKQLPIDEAVRIAGAVAAALAYAHGHQVIHRDLKPENILLQAGQPVVADFGIALAVSNAGGQRITQTGLSLGTPQYMSPEQATGDRAIDGRSDIYSLGAILYEMLTGDPPHVGSTAQAIIARVLTEAPRRIQAVRPNVPEHVGAAVMRALEKLPADRWNTAQAFADALSSGASATASVTYGALPRRRAWATHWRWIAALAAVAVVALVGWLRPTPRAPNRVARFVLTPPNGTDFAAFVSGVTGSFSFSPDGKSLAFSAKRRGQTALLYLQALDELEARGLPGTDGATFPAFSPDGKWIAFLNAAAKLMKIPASGGSPTLVVDLGITRLGQFSWLSNDAIVFEKDRDVLWTVSADGGSPTPIGVKSATGEDWQIAPQAIGDGDLVLYAAARGSAADDRIGVFSAKAKKSVVFENLTGQFPVGFADGKILYVRVDGSLMAADFDRRAMRVGSPVQVADGIDVQTRNAAVALSPAGDLAYIHGTSLRQLMVVDDRGTGRPLSQDTRALAHPRLSPDGKRIAFDEERRQNTDIWVFDIAAGTFAKVTSGGINDRPEWTPDGTRLLYSSNHSQRASNQYAAWSQIYDGSTPPIQVYDGPESIREIVATPDGRSYVVRADATTTLRDIYFLPQNDKTLTPLVTSAADELMPRVSPDGRWLAYVSNESGRQEVYVRPLGGPVGRVAISAGGGTEPVWARHGLTLFYRSGPQLVATTLTASPALVVSSRRVLFEGTYLTAPFHASYDVMPDDKSFVMVKPVDEERQFVVVLNWREELRRRLAGQR